MSLDYSVFASPNFDPNDYANAILAGDPYPPPENPPPTTAAKSTISSKLNPPEASTKSEDISLAISKLSSGIDDVARQIKALVTSHHEQLLAQAASANELSGSLTSARLGLTELNTSVDKLRLKIRIPYQSMQENVTRLQKFQQASDILRRTSRFVVLARRLASQMAEMESLPGRESEKEATKPPERSVALNGDIEDEKERTIAKAALSIAELVALLDRPKDDNDDTETPRELEDPISTPSLIQTSLRSVNAVAAFVPFLDDAKTKVTSEMENMVLTGLTTLNQSLLASSLQTAFNLRVLPQLVQSLISDLSQAVEERIRSAFDMNKISRDASGKDPTASPLQQTQSPTLYRSRVRTEPTNLTAPQWSVALWARLEKMIEEMSDCCVKVYTLEKVLKLKKDTVSQTVFLDEAMKLLENTPSVAFWTSLSRSLEKTTRDASRGSAFLQQTLSNGYPRLLRLFHEFFAKVAVYTDTVYIHTHQSPETVLVLRALSAFESQYLARSSNKLSEVVGQSFTGGSRSPPGFTEAVNITRTFANELDSARFDPLLVRSVAKNVSSSTDMVLTRTEALVARDRSAVTLVGPSATPTQIVNGSLATLLYHCHAKVVKLFDEHSEDVSQILRPGAEKLDQAYNRIVESLSTAIRRDLGNIIDRIHRTDFGRSDPGAGMGGASMYMKDLVDKLSFIRTEILSRFSVGEDVQKWSASLLTIALHPKLKIPFRVVSIVKFVLKIYVIHVSITRPLSESGKLQMTSDMTELEFALNAFMIDPQTKRGDSLESIGDEYVALRAMRPLLFLDNAHLASPTHTTGLPPMIVLNHILVRSPLPLPHTYHGWQDAEYVRYVDEHSEQQVWSLVESGLERWEKLGASDDTNTKEAAEEYVDLARKFESGKDSGIMASLLFRCRGAPGPLPCRLFSTSHVARSADQNKKPPQPPRSIDDSTSALEYKRLQRAHPPPLPAMDVPRNRTAEEAVTNILYNTPPPSLQPFKKHILNCLVQNEPGVLSRVSGILAGRGFNIDSLVVCRTEIRDLSRMSIVLSGQEGVVEQARRQLEDLVPVWAVLDYTDTRTITRELLLVKVSILGPEYLEEQLLGGPTHEPRRHSPGTDKLEREAQLAHQFEMSAHPEQLSAEAHAIPPTLTPSEALRVKHQHLQSIHTLASQFGAKIVDVSENSVIVELTAKTTRVEAFLSLVKPFGILESARTGLMAMPRTPISGSVEEDLVEDLSGPIDASLLPPG
ncbi:hypothetical protein V5O48_001671 [Marasmius crinis-equi]|uniref:Conserved oligomeric Golgi complex subunit 5 n=1 Tax=Marasmius crinis-equi TaxID=585013 RepID=A0ABR3FYB3_9AGAR